MEQFLLLIFLALGGSALAGSVKVINQGDEALVEKLGSYNKKLGPGLNFVTPFLDKIVYKQTIREKVLDIPPQQCITRDNVSITVDAVVYWRIMDMERAYYKVENLQSAMVNLVLTQIRSEMGQLELDETFTARSQINELLLRDLDIATDPWGVKVTRVELRDIIPSKAVQESMELQMSAERRKRASILTSEGDRESAVNSARGKADAQILDAEARQKAVILQAEAEQKAIVLRAQAERQQQVLKAQAIAESAEIIAQKIKNNPDVQKSLEVLFALGYLDMGATIGKSDSSKVMFIDPRSIPATLEGIKSIIADGQELPGINHRG
ncbi:MULTISPECIES: SPFH domain-containing protein [unclassified Tolypothrix]|uniref:SPFH domain-containing protein n=1 Tax=unclassified Tolypothrix TaxID=2649714 RepID=UPI0005EAA2F2|nr:MULTISPECIES: SPFH domain-containing protein [unclassified Tolypothrix]BAY95392.1 band 7 protein [Microchaete diplosiphon NIES-3275]EKF00623.1 SPFH domain / Band 7 family protein [Tolypothrix sp. PCC 7601]MBE9086345.1 SPFH/Band 7/PHB domain protein [Tolypothrix sp. LEGE 11397]UYD28700.1 SPFH/Band 7/PHB domain protein [Tolypothrix sp. PCC 7712]UYD35387.1 SPFH/Band 7/PHB domain protein [Tolypothrix sp. PCC 7601]